MAKDNIHKGWKRVNSYFGFLEGYSSVPSLPGNYAIYTSDVYLDNEKNKELHYIGTAQNLSVRLNKHEVIRVIKQFSGKYIFIKCKVILDKDKRLRSEYKLINRLRPGINNDPKKR